MLKGRQVVALVLLAGSLATSGAAIKPVGDDAVDRAKLYAWLDSFGAKDLLSKPIVEVRDLSGAFHFPSDSPRYGFVLERRGERAWIENLDLTSTRILLDPRRKQFKLVPADLRRCLARQKDLIERNADSGDLSDSFVIVNSPMLSRLADLLNDRSLAEYFYTKAHWVAGRTNAGISVSEAAERQLSNQLLWELYPSFSDRSVSRKWLLDRATYLAARFPKGPYGDAVKELSGTLSSMVAEDEHRSPLSKAQVDALPPAAQASELVWQLRNQGAGSFAERGVVSFFPDNSPSWRLSQLGAPAVPALIEALSDQHLTRCAETWNFDRVAYPPKVLRVCDAALQILKDISGREFGGVYSMPRGNDEKVAEIKRQVLAWDAQLNAVGEEKLLVQEVSKGGPTAYVSAQTLVRRFPQSAFLPVKSALEHTTNAGARQSLIASLENLHRPEVIPYAMSLMWEGDTLQTRLAGAQIVFHYSPETAARAMAWEWPAAAANNEEESGRSWTTSNLFQFLVSSRSLAAIEVIRTSLPNLPVCAKGDVAMGITCASKAGWQPRTLSDSERIAYDRKVEEILGDLLEDQSEDAGITTSLEGLQARSPLISTLASHRLASLWPLKYKFHASYSTRETERNRELNLNIWRQSRGMALIPLSSGPAIPKVSMSVLKPGFDRVALGRGGEDEVVEFGLGSLAPLLSYAKHLGAQRRTLVEPVSVKLANIVREVHLRNFPPGSEAIAERLKALQGKSLTAEVYVSLLSEVVNSWHAVGGAAFRVERDADGTGIVVFADLGVHANNRGTTFAIEEFVDVGEEEVMMGGFDGGGSAFPKLDEDKRFVTAIRKAFSAAPLKAVNLSVKFERG